MIQPAPHCRNKVSQRWSELAEKRWKENRIQNWERERAERPKKERGRSVARFRIHLVSPLKCETEVKGSKREEIKQRGTHTITLQFCSCVKVACIHTEVFLKQQQTGKIHFSRQRTKLCVTANTGSGTDFAQSLSWFSAGETSALPHPVQSDHLHVYIQPTHCWASFTYIFSLFLFSVSWTRREQ